jgi:hypothetical protein
MEIFDPSYRYTADTYLGIGGGEPMDKMEMVLPLE